MEYPISIRVHTLCLSDALVSYSKFILSGLVSRRNVEDLWDKVGHTEAGLKVTAMSILSHVH